MLPCAPVLPGGFSPPHRQSGEGRERLAYYAGCKFSTTISLSGFMNGDGTAYGWLSSGQPVKFAVLYSYQYGSFVSGIAGSCSTMIFCRPKMAVFWAAASAVCA